MPNLYQLRAELLADERITDSEVEIIRDHIAEDGELDLDDVKFLVELLSDAREVCSAFDELFFPVLKEVILEDGRIGQDEQFYLLKMLYSDGHIRPSEKQFLVELSEEALEVTPEFEALCEEAFAAHPTNWDVGGR
ncbi:MAG: TerB family tellurite resistance protein [Planctomycetes bacterium]|nr:TerB family tellurite resistance protein [Planctomycetota bacterium]